MNFWKVILATVVIFGAGVFTGGLLVNYVDHSHRPRGNRPLQPPMVADNPNPHPQNGTNHDQPRPGDFPKLRAPEMWGKEFVQKLDDSLQLAPEQHDAIQKIVADGQRRNSEIWSNALPQMRQIMTETRQQIREQLSPEQQKQFEDLMKRPPKRQQNSTNAPPTSTFNERLQTLTNAPAN